MDIKIIISAAAILSAAAAGLLVFLAEKMKDEKPGLLNKGRYDDKPRSDHYRKTRKFLSGYGADYMFRHEINPVYYDFVKILAGLAAAFTAGAGIAPVLAVPGFLTGIMLPDIVLKISNKSDNKAIMADVKAMYDTLTIKAEAGVFFSASLPECYKSVENKRLKAALYKLNTDIRVKNDIAASINEFHGKFKSEYIDMFCVIITQAMESGQTLNILNDMSKQLKNIQKAVAEEKKAKLERDVMTVQLLIYVALIAVILFYIFAVSDSLSMNF